MEVLCEVRAVNENYDQQSKVKARVNLEVLHPFGAIEIAIFENAVKSGVLGRFKTLVGQKVMVPIEINEYKGKVQYQIAFGGLPCSLQEIMHSMDIPFSKPVDDKAKPQAVK